MRRAVDEELIRICADEQSFSRGRVYFAEGRVIDPSFTDRSATAVVDGSSDYRVRLDLTHNWILGSCSCRQSAFCKHCVAVALAWRAQADCVLLPERPAPTDDERLRAHLVSRDHDWLAAELLRAAEDDPLLRARLEVAAGAAEEDVLDLAEFHQALTLSTFMLDEYPDEPEEAEEWEEAMKEILEEVTRMAEAGFNVSAIRLTEFTIDLLIEHDERYRVTSALRLAQRVHEAACVDGHPDPQALADRLVSQTLAARLFDKALPAYARALGVTGLAKYRELVEDARAGLDQTHDPELRAAITSMMERLAEYEAGPDRLIESLADAEPSRRQIQRIAEMLASESRTDEALRWIDRGLASLDPENTDKFGDRSFMVELRVLAAKTLVAAGKRRRAVEFFWPAFLARPLPEMFRLLAETAGDHWPRWRETALIRLREHLARSTEDNGFDMLVDILLSEQDIEGAWQAVRGGGVSLHRRLEVVMVSGTRYPVEAYPVLVEAAQCAIAGEEPRHYKRAARLLTEAQLLARACGHAETFAHVMAELRAEHEGKFGLPVELDKAHLP